ncbi:MAG: PAS domain S-box protein, partial [Candidatus Competibacteraceae bacterium]|nr:PAS domain S-box protein [Candidatus Competibacteraceae bacterium]
MPVRPSMPEHTRPPTPDSALSAEDYSAGGHAAPHAAILNAIPGGVLIHRQFSPLYANTAAARLLGFTTPTELLAQTNLLDLFPPALQAARLQRADAVLHEGVVQPPDIIPLATRSGLRWLEISESRFDWPGGPAVLVTLQDVSQQVQTQHSETLLREAINELSDSFILYDADDRVVLTNRRFHQIFPFLPAQDKIKGTAMAEMVRRSVANNVVTDP